MNTLKIRKLSCFALGMLIFGYAEQHCSSAKGRWLKIALVLHPQITAFCSSPPHPAWQHQANHIVSMPDTFCEHTLVWMRSRFWRKGNTTDEGGNCTARAERSDLCKEGASRKKRLALCREQRQTHRGGEGDVHRPQARSDWEKDGQSWCAGVLVSVTTIHPTGASGLR